MRGAGARKFSTFTSYLVHKTLYLPGNSSGNAENFPWWGHLNKDPPPSSQIGGKKGGTLLGLLCLFSSALAQIGGKGTLSGGVTLLGIGLMMKC